MLTPAAEDRGITNGFHGERGVIGPMEILIKNRRVVLPRFYRDVISGRFAATGFLFNSPDFFRRGEIKIHVGMEAKTEAVTRAIGSAFASVLDGNLISLRGPFQPFSGRLKYRPDSG